MLEETFRPRWVATPSKSEALEILEGITQMPNKWGLRMKGGLKMLPIGHMYAVYERNSYPKASQLSKEVAERMLCVLNY